MADQTRVGLKSLSPVFVLLREFNRFFLFITRSQNIIYLTMLYYNNSRNLGTQLVKL